MPGLALSARGARSCANGAYSSGVPGEGKMKDRPDQRPERALRVRAAFLAEAERAALGRDAAAAPPSLPPLRMGE